MCVGQRSGSWPSRPVPLGALQTPGFSTPHPIEELISWETLTVLEQVDEQLKLVYAHYATLEIMKPNLMTWAAVQEHGNLLNSDSLVLFMLNFDLAPVLVTKNHVREGDDELPCPPLGGFLPAGHHR